MSCLGGRPRFKGDRLVRNGVPEVLLKLRSHFPCTLVKASSALDFVLARKAALAEAVLGRPSVYWDAFTVHDPLRLRTKLVVLLHRKLD